MADQPRGSQEPPPVVRDRRRVDPATGELRSPVADRAPTEGGPAEGGPAEGGPADAGAAAPQAPDVAPELTPDLDLAAERLADLQRLQAEYMNYRRRVDRDRSVARDAGTSAVLEALLPVLDDVHLARLHGDLEGGPFGAISDKLDATLTRFGLARYGEPGEPFDPVVHEALMHTDDELAEGTAVTTVVRVLQPGYRVGERVLRPARVAVADPT